MRRLLPKRFPSNSNGKRPEERQTKTDRTKRFLSLDCDFTKRFIGGLGLIGAAAGNRLLNRSASVGNASFLWSASFPVDS